MIEVVERKGDFQAVQFIAGKNEQEIISLLARQGYKHAPEAQQRQSSTLKFRAPANMRYSNTLSVWNKCWILIPYGNGGVRICRAEDFDKDYRRV